MEKKKAEEALKGVIISGLIEIKIKDGFFYKMTTKNEKESNVDTGWNKNPKDGWINLKKAVGQYCGENSITENDFHLKVRIKEPFKITSFHGNYLVLCISDLLSIRSVS